MKRLRSTPVVTTPNWNLSFELMCNASNYAIDLDEWEYTKRWEKLQQLQAINKKWSMPLHNILVGKYLTVEAIPYRTNDHKEVVKFLRQNIFLRFGVPRIPDQ